MPCEDPDEMERFNAKLLGCSASFRRKCALDAKTFMQTLVSRIQADLNSSCDVTRKSVCKSTQVTESDFMSYSNFTSVPRTNYRSLVSTSRRDSQQWHCGISRVPPATTLTSADDETIIAVTPRLVASSGFARRPKTRVKQTQPCSGSQLGSAFDGNAVNTSPPADDHLEIEIIEESSSSSSTSSSSDGLSHGQESVEIIAETHTDGVLSRYKRMLENIHSSSESSTGDPPSPKKRKSSGSGYTSGGSSTKQRQHNPNTRSRNPTRRLTGSDTGLPGGPGCFQSSGHRS